MHIDILIETPVFCYGFLLLLFIGVLTYIALRSGVKLLRDGNL